MNKKYEKFLENFNSKRYTSLTAEYKRTVRQSFKININKNEDIIFNEIIHQILKKTDTNNRNSLLEGDKIETKNHFAYIHKIIKNKIFSYIYKGKKSQDFFIVTFEIESTSRNYSIVKYTYESKRQNTIAGFNGTLGKIKFKKQAKLLGKNTLEKLKIICEKK